MASTLIINDSEKRPIFVEKTKKKKRGWLLGPYREPQVILRQSELTIVLNFSILSY